MGINAGGEIEDKICSHIIETAYFQRIKQYTHLAIK